MCPDGPCHRTTGDRIYGVAQAILATVGVTTCVAAIATGAIHLASEHAGEQHLRLRVAAVAAFGIWVGFVIVGRLAGAH